MLLTDALNRWSLALDGEPIRTVAAELFPVRWGETAAMLKITRSREEQAGTALLRWWNGEGAVRILAEEENALLMERACGARSLIEMARTSQDDEATRILCAVAGKLHAPRSHPQPKLTPLTQWFRSLEMAATAQEGIFLETWNVARNLLAPQQEIVPLHGDLHHGNVLDAGARGWLAIDPKGLLGERTYDFANIFCNPDKETATRPGRLVQQAAIVAEAANLNHSRLLQWIQAYAALSAAWSLEDKEDPALALEIASRVAQRQGNS